VSGPELVIHGHFYQPPRENPWTEEVGRERSAAPFHDWNERIAAESYRPNGLARVVGDHNNIIGLVNNYALMSYNVGPTLMSWLERHAPDIYELMVSSDAEGHGAIAQAFGHTILPLATESDVRLQVRWGLADFRYRFGREAEGMWLPECAVNDMVLRVLAEEGVRFTILAPGQAAQMRSLDGSHDWVDVQQSWFDTSRPYRWVHPDGDGKGVDIVFYNGPLSHTLAFEMSGLSSQALVDRMIAASMGRNGLVTLATDGETFGHHHRYGERLLAYALDVEAPNRGLKRTNLNNFVSENRPTHEVRVHESAWSCAHGVGRWKEDCGCETGAGPGWNQRWRSPLRAALNGLRARVEMLWNDRAGALFLDADAARFEYVNVLIGAESQKSFAAAHITGDEVDAFTLLEMQRHAQSMFTSCGWFFNDLAGIETVQILRYAAHVVDLINELGEDPHLETFLSTLAEAYSNVGSEGNGVDIWNRHVVTARVDAERAVQHLALSEVIENEARESFGAYEIEVRGRTRTQRGSVVLASGVACLTHRRTRRTYAYAYAALGLGGLEVVGSLRRLEDEHDETALESIRSQFEGRAPVTNLLRALSEMGPAEFDLSVALPDERDRLMSDTAAFLTERYAESYQRLYADHRAALEDLVRYGYNLPPELRAPAEVALAHQFQTAVMGAESSTNPQAYDSAIAIARQARATGFEVDSPTTSQFVERLVKDAVFSAVKRPNNKTVRAALDVLKLKDELGVGVNLDACQEALYFAVHSERFSEALLPLAEALGVAT
jgi:alpha-amylase/alpha-mannosidase (GH57 family)